MVVKIGLWPILIVSFLFIFLYILKIDILVIVFTACIIYFLCKQRQDYYQSDQTESKHVTVGFNFYLHPKDNQRDIVRKLTKKSLFHQNDYSIQGSSTQKYYNTCGVREYSTTNTFTNPFNMWGNRSFSNTSGRTPTKTSNGLGRTRNLNSPVNTSMPLNVSSPVLRQRKADIGNKSMLSPAGPLLSSPFMPQIKRALGLEPKTNLSYSQRRSSVGMNTSVVVSPASPGTMPHVRLNKPSRQSLTDRNSSMLARSSTVKIAPPMHGKVATPSLSQLRNESISNEDRSTPDTYAVVSALKERRKRSINTHEELQDHPVPHAKRRRQESQQSNASTSSMPSLPDNLPDLTNTDFTMRLETPGIKRPSRPSQEDQEEWQKEAVVKRRRSDYRNNSILSSLSSSSRFIKTQIIKRKASTSFTEKENERSPLSKSQRQDPPKLTHINMIPSPDIQSTPRTEPCLNGNTEATESETNGHAEVDQEDFKKPEKQTSDPIPIKRLPSMKKTASIYTGLSSKGSFKKVQYANVVATIDDYDSDREAEQNRVKQMLQDIDNTFTEKEAQKSIATTSTATTVTTTVAVSSLLSYTTTTSTSTAASTTTSSVLSALEKLSKSPSLADQTGKEATKPGVGLNLGTPLSLSTAAVTPVVTQKSALGSPVTSPVEDSVSLDKKEEPPSYFAAIGGSSLGTSLGAPASVVNQSTNSAVSLMGSTILSTPSAQPAEAKSTTTTPASGFTFGANTSSTGGLGTTTAAPGGFSFGASAVTTVTTPASSTATVQSLAGGFSFGSTSTAATTTSASTTVAGPTQGFSFGAVSSTPASTTTATSSLASGFTFGAAPASSTSTNVTTAAPLGGFSFGASSSVPTASLPTLAAPGGFSFASVAPTASTIISTPSIGAASTAASTPAFPGFGSAGGFQFGSSGATTTASSTPATTVSTAALPGGFSFGAGSTRAPTATAAGFSFGAGSSTTAATPGGFSFGSAPAASTANSAVPSLFGAPTPATTASAATFNFGAGSTGSAFGSTAATTTTTSSTAGFAFGASQQPGTTAPSLFGAPPTSTTAATGFTFGATPASTAQSGFAFGAAAPKPATTTTTATVASPFSFGAGAPAAAPAFGSTGAQVSSAPAFNFGQATTQASAAPAPGVFAFGNSAGGSTGQAPAFGSANPAPAFGTANQPPAFGSTSANQPPAFGSTSSNQLPAFGSASTNPPPAFGAPSQTAAFGAVSTTQSTVFGGNPQQAPAFGSGTSNAPSAFGSAIGASPSFGKSHSMPTFGNVDSSTGGFNFGAQAAPNVNPFGTGQTTPAKQTGSAFGQMNNDTTPKQQTGALFQFGGNQSNTNSSANQGFNFAAANTNQNTGGFNFMAASSTPVFNFGAAASTPGPAGFGTPGATPGTGAFSMGTSEAARPPRIMSRARRRGPKK